MTVECSTQEKLRVWPKTYAIYARQGGTWEYSRDASESAHRDLKNYTFDRFLEVVMVLSNQQMTQFVHGA